MQMEDRLMHFAWLGAQVVNMFSKRKYSPRQLLGKVRDSNPRDLKSVRERAFWEWLDSDDSEV